MSIAKFVFAAVAALSLGIFTADSASAQYGPSAVGYASYAYDYALQGFYDTNRDDAYYGQYDAYYGYYYAQLGYDNSVPDYFLDAYYYLNAAGDECLSAYNDTGDINCYYGQYYAYTAAYYAYYAYYYGE